MVKRKRLIDAGPMNCTATDAVVLGIALPRKSRLDVLRK
jgi:hypothetical protein